MVASEGVLRCPDGVLLASEDVLLRPEHVLLAPENVLLRPEHVLGRALGPTLGPLGPMPASEHVLRGQEHVLGAALGPRFGPLGPILAAEHVLARPESGRGSAGWHSLPSATWEPAGMVERALYNSTHARVSAECTAASITACAFAPSWKVTLQSRCSRMAFTNSMA